ncbi:sulfurtransferase [Pseudorhodoferax sp.]|uniref:sulfurtransferase n=1 Tax=Pseudorhodoferax sp. TaxID=1993553 RepID=UPI002DD6523D|nr:sulfurtransferase [Pseudorhodoferax sp.]
MNPQPPTPLIQATELAERLHGQPQDTVVFDCSFDLADTAAGARAYAQGHVPGALYLNLDSDLSAAKTGRNGRHPLPERAVFAARLAALGVGRDSFVVAYDRSGGMYAARLWWMLRWAGHGAVAVLDGGWQAWQGAGLAAETAAPAARAPGDFTLRPAQVATVDRQVLLDNLRHTQPGRRRLVIDARAPDRFRGENETLDAIGGHIPGAVNRLFRDNLGPDGRFKPAAQLRSEFAAVAGSRPSGDWVNSCGSGVTACHNLLAQQVAGFDDAALYPGSWSEWSSWPDSPIATGEAGPAN